jgi:class 3 adenylate cyclase/predicted ATPase
MDVGGWLRRLGLGRYEAAFRENEIDETVLPSLTHETLKELGVTALGHRLKLLDAIAALRPYTGAPEPSGGPLDTSRTPSVSSEDHAERRQVTVMFSDLVGSTALSARMDPEDLREIISGYQKCVTETVGRFGGFVAKYMGDGVLVYFGYPEANEDDAERAVRAGLELVAAVGQLKTHVPLQTRVGIATGLVVVGDLIGSGASQEQAIVGETPNLAARLQGIAEPNSTVIAEATRSLLGNLFELQDLGPRELKGIAGPVRAFAVQGASSAEGRFEAMHAGGMTELVGREEELGLLLRRWARAKTGEGQVVLLSGEAGIGKSRLSAALMEALAAEPHTRLRYFCSPQHTDSAFYPLIGQFERAAGFAHGDTPQAKLDKLDALLGQTSTSRQDAALLAAMLSLPNDGRYPALDLNPEQRRQKTLEALSLQLETLARSSPVLMILEDVHWADPTSLEAFGRTVDQIASLRVLLIVTLRPEFEAPWIGQPHVTTLALNRLGHRDVNTLIERVVGNKPLPADIRKDIIERTDGIPLFVEEMTKAVLEAGGELEAMQIAVAVPSPARAVPASLHASLMARLDRIGTTAKEIAQIGAAIGREFSYELLVLVAHKNEEAVKRSLGRLSDAGLVFSRGAPPQATFLFKHALVQDAAYGTLLRGPRRSLHAQIATAMEGHFPEIVETRPELLAHHFAEAKMVERAIRYWLRGGERASERSANIEAIAHLSNGLKLVETLSDTPQRVETEFALQMAIGGPLTATKGYAAPEVERTYLRARELCERLGRSSELFPVLRGLWNCYFTRGELLRAGDLAEQLAVLAQEQGRSLQRALAHRSLGSTRFFLGRFSEAREQLDQAISFDEAAASGNRRAYISLYADSPGVIGRLHLSCIQWLLGFPERAVATLEAGLALSEALATPSFHALALTFSAIVRQWRQEFQAARRQAEAAITVAREHGLSARLAIGTICRGVALAHLGQHEEGIAEVHAGFACWHGTGARLYDPMWHCFTAEAHAAAGQFDAAFDALDRASETAAATAQLFYQAELHRLKGAYYAARGERIEAEVWLKDGIKFARSQAAKSLELRAATGLARLWRAQGKCTEAHDLLAPVYGWFTEGFNTRDLQEAKALLDKLL